MKILMVNKFLKPRGGAETYVLALGAQLAFLGHEVQYFGMEQEGRTVGNRVNAYTRNLDFHGASPAAKLTYPFRVIYSIEARRKLRRVLEDFQPDVCHLNNFHYQLTPSILPEIRAWSRETGHSCKILYTAHDFQLVCPNHMCRNPNTGENCEKCLGGSFIHCALGRCIHGSLAKSILGTLEARFWNRAGVYGQIDHIICCSHFLKEKLDTNPVLAKKTRVMVNFTDMAGEKTDSKQDYVLYFGRYAREKGVELLIQAAKALPGIPFVFAGTGPLEDTLDGVPNIRNVGFQTGEELKNLIQGARFSVCPSVCYENCPFSVLESLALGTPVLGAKTGGIPELIRPGQNGALFESGNPEDLKEKLSRMWDSGKTPGCGWPQPDTVENYAQKLLGLLGQEEPWQRS